jgi:hypothetical protein
MVWKKKKRTYTMKILIRLVNGFNVGLQLCNQEVDEAVVKFEDETVGTTCFFTGLLLNIGFIQVKMGDFYIPLIDDD